MNIYEIDKGDRFVLSEIIEYVPNSVVSNILLKKLTGTVRIFSVDSGKVLSEKTSPFDTLIQVIEGAADITIEAKTSRVEAGQAIIIPAHARNSIVAIVRFKMLSTIIKSGYEEIT